MLPPPHEITGKIARIRMQPVIIRRRRVLRGAAPVLMNTAGVNARYPVHRLPCCARVLEVDAVSVEERTVVAGIPEVGENAHEIFAVGHEQAKVTGLLKPAGSGVTVKVKVAACSGITVADVGEVPN